MASFRELLRAAKAEIDEVDIVGGAQLLDGGHLLLDVREPDEYDQGAIPGSLHIPRGTLETVIDGPRILEMRALARDVPVARHVQDYAIRILEGTHPDREGAPEMVQRFVRFGASPRGAQACLLAAKIQALMDGRFAVGADDVRAVAKPALRHRMILNFEGEAEGVRTDAILDRILETTKETSA